MTPEEIRATAIERIAEAEYLRWAESRAEESVWTDCATDLAWRQRFIDIGTRAVDALGDLLPTATPDAWLIGYRDQHGGVKDDWNGITYPTFEEAQADLARDCADSALDLRLFELREVRS